MDIHWDDLAHVASELGNMHTRAAVNLWRIFLSHHGNSHNLKSSLRIKIVVVSFIAFMQ